MPLNFNKFRYLYLIIMFFGNKLPIYTIISNLRNQIQYTKMSLLRHSATG